jgi:hypothetical protein
MDNTMYVGFIHGADGSGLISNGGGLGLIEAIGLITSGEILHGSHINNSSCWLLNTSDP